MKCLPIIVILLLVTSCNKELSKANGCGLLFNYSRSFQTKAKEQVEAISNVPEFKELKIMAEDYSKTRKSIRSCERIKKSKQE